jgi:hypothetical protein
MPGLGGCSVAFAARSSRASDNRWLFGCPLHERLYLGLVGRSRRPLQHVRMAGVGVHCEEVIKLIGEHLLGDPSLG